jgi:hypothetical protein
MRAPRALLLVLALAGVGGCAHDRVFDPKRAAMECGTFRGCMSCLWACVLCGYPVEERAEGEGEGEGE